MFSKYDHLLDNKYTYPVLLALTFGVSILIQLFSLPGLDQTWFALMTRRMLDGVALYKDFFEPNMPLTPWLYAFPVWLAHQLSLPPVVAVRLFTTGIIAAMLPLCAYVLGHSSLWTHQQRRSLLLAIAAIFLLSPDPHTVFSQREHLLVIFILPYLLLNLPSVQQESFPLWIRVGLGALAAIGFCLKPYFAIPWLGLLAYKLVRMRTWKALFGPAEIAVGCLAAAYLAAVWIFVPQYFGFIRIISQIYGDVGFIGETVADKICWLFALGLTGIVLAWSFGLFSIDPASPYKGDLKYLLWLGTVTYIEALAQFKTWAYIPYPFIALGMLAIVGMILVRPRHDFYAFVVLALLFFPSLPVNSHQDTDERMYRRTMQKAIVPYEHSKDFYYLGISPPPLGFMRADAPLAWSGKFNRLFELGAIMQVSPVSGQPTLAVMPGKKALERWLLDNVAEDLEKKRPDLLVIDRLWRIDEPLSATFDMLAWVKTDPRLAEFLRHYTLRKNVEVCYDAKKYPYRKIRCSWRVYTRNGSP